MSDWTILDAHATNKDLKDDLTQALEAVRVLREALERIANKKYSGSGFSDSIDMASIADTALEKTAGYAEESK